MSLDETLIVAVVVPIAVGVIISYLLLATLVCRRRNNRPAERNASALVKPADGSVATQVEPAAESVVGDDPEYRVIWGPSHLTFKIALSFISVQHLRAVNSSKKHACTYKVRTNNPRRWLFRPRIGVIWPDSETLVQLMLPAEESYPSDVADCNDLFHLHTRQLTDGQYRCLAAMDPNERDAALLELWESDGRTTVQVVTCSMVIMEPHTLTTDEAAAKEELLNDLINQSSAEPAASLDPLSQNSSSRGDPGPGPPPPRSRRVLRPHSTHATPGYSAASPCTPSCQRSNCTFASPDSVGSPQQFFTPAAVAATPLARSPIAQPQLAADPSAATGPERGESVASITVPDDVALRGPVRWSLSPSAASAPSLAPAHVTDEITKLRTDLESLDRLTEGDVVHYPSQLTRL